MKYSQTIYLGVNDDIAMAIDKVAGAGTPEVILVIPPNAEIFSSIVNLKLLRREAENLKKHLVIATLDRTGQHLVERAGIELDKFNSQSGNDLRSETDRKENLDENVFDKGKDKGKETENYDSQRNRENISSLKNVSAPRMMADIIIPVRQAEPIVDHVFKKEEESAKQQKPIEFDEIEPAIQPTDDLAEPAVEIQPEYSQKGVETFWGQGNREPALINENYIAQRVEEPAQIYIPETKKEKKKSLFTGKRTKKLTYTFAAAGLVVFFAAAYFILPRAKLTIFPKKQDVAYNLSIVADKNITKIDYSLRKIPAQLIKIEKRETKEFAATGESAGSQKAHGTIIIYNNYSTAPQSLVATTRFVSKDSGKLFRLSKGITVPGAKMDGDKLVPSSISAEVVADQAGADYNIAPSEFTIPGFSGTPKYAGFYGKSQAAMTGGSAGKSKIVSAQDIENATKTMNDLLKDSQAQELKNQIPANLKLLDGALAEGEPEITFSVGVGTAAENFIASIKAQITALVFDPKYVNDLAVKSNSSLVSGKIENSDIEYINWKVNFDKGQISMDLKISQQGTGKIDIVNLKKLLAGKGEVEIRKTLSQIAEVQSAKINFWPFWVKTIPTQTDKIEIIIEENK